MDLNLGQFRGASLAAPPAGFGSKMMTARALTSPGCLPNMPAQFNL